MDMVQLIMENQFMIHEGGIEKKNKGEYIVIAVPRD